MDTDDQKKKILNLPEMAALQLMVPGIHIDWRYYTNMLDIDIYNDDLLMGWYTINLLDMSLYFNWSRNAHDYTISRKDGEGYIAKYKSINELLLGIIEHYQTSFPVS